MNPGPPWISSGFHALPRKRLGNNAPFSIGLFAPSSAFIIAFPNQLGAKSILRVD